MFDNASDNIRLDKRNYGIDLLRLVSMFLIVVLHSLSRGALVGVSPFNIHYEVGFLIEALTLLRGKLLCVNIGIRRCGFKI